MLSKARLQKNAVHKGTTSLLNQILPKSSPPKANPSCLQACWAIDPRHFSAIAFPGGKPRSRSFTTECSWRKWREQPALFQSPPLFLPCCRAIFGGLGNGWKRHNGLIYETNAYMFIHALGETCASLQFVLCSSQPERFAVRPGQVTLLLVPLPRVSDWLSAKWSAKGELRQKAQSTI